MGAKVPLLRAAALQAIRICALLALSSSIALSEDAGGAPAREAHDAHARNLAAIPNVALPALIPSGCVTNPFPSTPSGPSYSADFSGSTYVSGSQFRLTAWREACRNDPTRSAVFVRYTLLAGPRIFVCGGGGALEAIQNGTRYSSLLEAFQYSSTNNYLNSYCSYVTSAQTFLIDQWTIYTNFNDQEEFTVRYGHNDAYRLTIPRYTPNVPRRTLTVQLIGTGQGRVTSSPSGISCSTGSCQSDFYEGTTVTLTAVALGTSTFAGWGGSCSGSLGTTTISITAAKTCTARFNPAAVNPETGWWWASSEPGRGYSIELKNGRVFIASYAYRGDGSPAWYLSSGTWDGQSLSTSLDEYEGGQSLWSGWRPAARRGTVATATLTFSTPTRGSIAWSDGRVSSIERFMFAGDVQSEPAPSPEPKPVVPLAAPVDEASALNARVAAIGSVRVLVGLKQDGRTGGDQGVPVAQRMAATGSKLHYSLRSLPIAVATVTPAGLEALRIDPNVSFVHEDKIERIFLASSAPKIGAHQAWWAYDAQGAGQVIAVLDTGVDSGHPFFGGRVIQEACFSTTEPAYTATTHCPNGEATAIGPGSAAYCRSDPGSCRHGTHVAGITAGGTSGMWGIAPQASIVAVQVFTTFSAREICGSANVCIGAFNSDVLRALEWVRDSAPHLGISSINMSIGAGRFTTYCDSDVRKPVIDQLRAMGIPTIIATGNEFYGNAVASPACISSAIRVGATNNLDVVQTFTNEWALPMLVAPGYLVRSSVPGGGFASLSGTSMAAPHVAGAWAALKSLRPDASVDMMYQLFTSTARSVRGVFNYPRIDLGVAAYRLTSIETGWWWNPSEPGRGFFVEVQRGNLFISVYMYGADQRAAWYIANGPYTRGTFTGNVMEFSGGQPIGGEWRQAQPRADYGQITLLPTGDGKVQATLPTGQQITLSRFAF